MIRAIRFAATLDFQIERDTYAAISTARDQLAKASNSRLYDEVLKLFFCGKALAAYRLLNATGLLEVMFPQFGPWLGRLPWGLTRIPTKPTTLKLFTQPTF